MRHIMATLVTLALAAPAGAGAPAKAEKPQFNVRATPRVALSPTMVFATAELAEGDKAEEYYCAEVLWDWDDGARSAHGQDCPAYEAGAPVQRRFTARHAYRQAGVYRVRVTLLRSGRPLTAANTTVNVRPGLGDMSQNDLEE
jgi:hypothetical protein